MFPRKAFPPVIQVLMQSPNVLIQTFNRLVLIRPAVVEQFVHHQDSLNRNFKERCNIMLSIWQHLSEKLIRDSGFETAGVVFIKRL